MKTQKIFFIGILIVGVFFNFSLLDAAPQETSIRVAIVKNADEVLIANRGRYTIIDPEEKKFVTRKRVLRKSKVSAYKEGIRIGSRYYPVKHIRLISKKPTSVALRKGNERKYRGNIDVYVMPNNQLLVVNTLDLEKYIKGVLYHEVTDRWPLHAMMAQAVAVRTYALYQASVNQDERFDVTSDIYSQVYGGKSGERYRTNIAVNRTRGQVLYYQQQVLPAYFHSNCGGHTENVEELWKHKDLNPLNGVICEFSQNAPNNHWKKNFRSKDIQDTLNKDQYNLGLIKEIVVLERNASGRIRNLKIVTRDGKSSIITGKKFRNLIGPNTIKSNNYEVVMKGYFFDLIGKGWGHGVGMCQWGAHEMSKQKYKYHEILAHYYPGAEIVQDGKNIIYTASNQ